MTAQQPLLPPVSGAENVAVAGHPPAPATATPLIVCGLDLSLTETGVAHVIGGTCVVELVKSTGRVDSTWEERGARLRGLRAQIVELVGRADLVVLESPAYAQSDRGAYDRAGLHWMVLSVLQARGIPVALMAPTSRALYITGSGRAAKAEVVAHIAKALPHLDIRSDNEADALGLALAGADKLGHPVLELPAKNRKALNAGYWPSLGVAA